MKLILHIGTEKTGTTTTQVWAAHNREALARQGVFYSRVLGSACHVKLHLWCLTSGRHDESFQRLKILSETERRTFQARLPDEFAAEVSDARNSGCHTFLISNELCHSRLVMREEVQRAREFLQPHFDNIEILCGLRPQIDLAVSHASNLTKAGLRVTGAYFDTVGPDSSYFNYRTLAAQWSAVFGAETLRLVPMRRTPDFIAVFAAHAGIDTKDLEPPVRVNEALDIRVLAMTNAMAGPKSSTRRIESFAQVPREVLKRLPCEERLRPGLEVARSVQARFEESNRELTNGRTDVEFSDLEPDWNRYEGPGNLDLLEQSCGFSEQLAALVQAYNQIIATAELHNEIADSERHLDLHHPVLAQRSLNAAQRLLALLKQAGVTRGLRRFEARMESLEKGLETSSRDAPRRKGRQAGKEHRRAKKEPAQGGRSSARGEHRQEKGLEADGRPTAEHRRVGKPRREKKRPIRPQQPTGAV